MTEQSSYYKYCITAGCYNTTRTVPHKVYIRIPPGTVTREKWLKACGRDPKSFSPSSRVYVCEDHFNLKEDMENFMKFKMVGGNIKMKKNAVPHVFDCQNCTETAFPYMDGPLAINLRSNIVKDILEPSLYCMPSPSAAIPVNISENITYDKEIDSETFKRTYVVVPAKRNFGVMVKPYVRSKSVQCQVDIKKNVLSSRIKPNSRDVAQYF